MSFTLVGTWLYLNIPKLAKGEPRRVSMIYRSYAEEMKEDVHKANYSGGRKKGWRQRGKIDGASWGYVASDKTCEVWLAENKDRFLAREVPLEKEIDYMTIGVAGAIILFLFLGAFTTLAVIGFIKYWRDRDDFIAAIVHDLTTPLVGIRMFIGSNDEEASRLVEMMLRMVKNLKETLSRGVGERAPQIEEFNLVEAFEEAYKLHRLDFEDMLEGGVTRLSSIKILNVKADTMMTTQVIWNLLGNELKYAASWGKVEVDFRAEGDKAILEFRDEGPGMTQYQKRHAFDRYYRAKSIMKSGKGGFGIGLCTAREYARKMKGDIHIYDNTPRGCVFTLVLPTGKTRSKASNSERNMI